MIKVKTSKKERPGTKIRIFLRLDEDSVLPPSPNDDDDLGWDLWVKMMIARQRYTIHQAVMNDPTLPFADDKLTWVVTAGCWCGCSPGFIAETKGDVDYHLVKMTLDKK